MIAVPLRGGVYRDERKDWTGGGDGEVSVNQAGYSKQVISLRQFGAHDFYQPDRRHPQNGTEKRGRKSKR